MTRSNRHNKRAVSEALEPRRLLATFVVTSGDDAGEGTLRQAILDANAAEGADRIEFNLGDGGVQRINVVSSLPAITDTTAVDGATQPGFAGQPLVEIAGPAKSFHTPGRVYGFDVAAPDCVIQTISMFGFDEQIRLNSQRAIIQGCWLGLNAAGEKPNYPTGVYYLGVGIRGMEGSSHNLIGGEVASARNVISANTWFGVVVDGDRNVFKGNYVGLDPTGTLARGNSGIGIGAAGNHNTIGGTTAAARNVIAANALGVMVESGSASYNTVQGNYIGTDAAGTQKLGNKIAIQIRGIYNLIGGEGPAGNLIAHQTEAAIIIRKPVLPHLPSHGNRIYGNVMYGNAGLPIDIEEGVAITNDTLDADTGANERQNHPLIQTTSGNTSTTQIVGTLNSTPNREFTIHFYATRIQPPLIVGVDQVSLGSLSLVTDELGQAIFNHIVPFSRNGSYRISATATDSDGNTSEFSPLGDLRTATISPVVTSWRFDYAKARPEILIQFSEHVSTTIQPSYLRVETASGGSVPNPFSVTYDTATRTAKFVLVAKLADGRYRAQLETSSIRNLNGTPVITPSPFEFFALDGDINRDRQVGFTDLLTVSANFGKSSATFADGDIDLNGSVGFADLLRVSGRFGAQIVMGAAPLGSDPLAQITAQPAFSDQPIATPRPTAKAIKKAPAIKRLR